MQKVWLSNSYRKIDLNRDSPALQRHFRVAQHTIALSARTFCLFSMKANSLVSCQGNVSPLNKSLFL